MTTARYASPLSFSGSGSRLTTWGKRASLNRPPWIQISIWILVVSAITVVWALVFSWYVLIYTMFGLWVIPYRLIRRGQRRRKAQAKAIRQMTTRPAQSTRTTRPTRPNQQRTRA